MSAFDTYEWLNQEKARYYTITVRQQSQNEIALDYKWGGCNSNRGGNKRLCVKSLEEAQQNISNMMKRRKSRGYKLITPLN